MTDLEFNSFWKIYEDSFPKDERRTREGQLNILKKDIYSIKLLKEKNEVRGFVAYWKLDEYIYIDHIAIDSAFRGLGYGTKMLKMIKELSDKLILEVEPPICKENINRIKFYENSGLCLNEYDYIQPPLRADGNPVDLKLMTYPKKIDIEELKKMDKKLKEIVYGI